MSTDPEDDPPPFLPTIKAPNYSTDDSANRRSAADGDGEDDNGGCRTPTSIESRIPAALICPPRNLPMIKAPSTDDSANRRSASDGDGGDDDGGCRTPTSIESRIPAVMMCPPAPMKPRASYKRTTPEETFEKIHRAEIEALFRSCEEFGHVVVFCVEAKRRCLYK